MNKGLLLAFCLILCPLVTALAASIDFIATNVADSVPGQDLWRYDYTVSGRVFQASEFFDIYFDPNSYAALTAGPAPNADWDILVLQQPTPGNLPPFDQGIFDAFALSGNASLAGTFSVTFVYLGSGTPGSQPFEIYAADSDLAESGFTTAPPQGVIPEPSTMSLLAIGLTAWAIRIRRRSVLRR